MMGRPALVPHGDLVQALTVAPSATGSMRSVTVSTVQPSESAIIAMDSLRPT
jgi:hypothetical protein